ncbi:carbohydrate ABC transporter permease [Salinispira pacifica]
MTLARFSLADMWRHRLFYLFILPMLLLVVLFGAIPIAKSIQIAFTDSGSSLSEHPVYVGLRNFVTIFKDPYFINSLWTTVLFTVVSVPANVLVALLLALLLSSRNIGPGKVFFKLAVFIPVVAPIMATSVVWKWMYNSNFGAVNAILGAIGLPPFAGLSSGNTVLLSLGIAELWKHVGLYTIIFLTNLQLIDYEKYEAAYLEGANYLQRTWYITVPELGPAFTLNLIYATIQFLKTFAVALVMTQGGPNYHSNFVSYYAYTKFQIADYGAASAMGTVLFVIVLLITVAMRRVSSRGEVGT